MKKLRTVIIGSGPDNYVEKVIKHMSCENCELHVIVKKNRRSHFGSNSYRTYSFGRSIKWYNVYFLLLLMRIKSYEGVVYYLRKTFWGSYFAALKRMRRCYMIDPGTWILNP